MPRFVLLFHECPPDSEVPSHWDLMLEAQGVLLTWRLATLPPQWQAPSSGSKEDQPPITLDAHRLADHRVAYLDYQGPVSGGRGSVRRVDKGEYVVLSQSPGLLLVQLLGRHMRGVAELPDLPQPPLS